MSPSKFSPSTSNTMQTCVPFGPLCRKWSRNEITCDRPACVCEGDDSEDGCGFSGVGRTGAGGVEDVMSRWRSLISSSAVSVYRGADLTTLRATCRFSL